MTSPLASLIIPGIQNNPYLIKYTDLNNEISLYFDVFDIFNLRQICKTSRERYEPGKKRLLNISYYSAEMGSIGLFKKSLETHPHPSSKISMIAAQYGHLEYLKYLKNRLIWISNTICDLSAYYGHLDCLKWGYEIGMRCDYSTSDRAACMGHLDCLIFLHEKNIEINDLTLDYAYNNEHFHIIEYAIKNNWPYSDKFVIENEKIKQIKIEGN